MRCSETGSTQGQAGADSSDLLEELHRQDREADGLLVGRRTFEDLRGYWPKQSDDATGIADYLNQVQKHVVSSTMTEPEWQNSTILPGDALEATRALKEKPGRDIVVTGSITLCHTLIEASLVDEYRLFVYPLVQGRGRLPPKPSSDREYCACVGRAGRLCSARSTFAGMQQRSSRHCAAHKRPVPLSFDPRSRRSF